MMRLHDLMRLMSSLFPGRFLRVLLRLWERLLRRLALSSSTDHSLDLSKRSNPTVDTPHIISASYQPPSNGHVSLADPPRASSSRNRPEIDTMRPKPRVQLTGTTLVTSPVPLSPTDSPFQKDHESDFAELKPTWPSQSRRYNFHSPIEVGACKIPAGPPVHRGQQRFLPDDWHKCMHPEGQVYFVNNSRSISPIDIVTEAHIHDKEVRELVDDFSRAVLERAIHDGWHFNGSNIELLVLFNDEEWTCSYYFVDHENAVIFWLEELDTGDFDEMPNASGPDHFRTYLHEIYWLHQEYFPSHRQEPPDREKNLVATLTHNCIDVITSTTSTSSFDRSQLETMLSVMKSLKNIAGSDGQRNCIIARLWNDIYHTRFINFYGEKHARLFRTQIQPEEKASSTVLKFIFLLLFDAPSTHLTGLQELYVDDVLYSDGWRKFIEALVHDWQDLILWATVLLAANMSFLAIFNSTDQVIAENRAVTCSLVSTLTSTLSVIVGLLHVRKHRPRARGHASDGSEYLEAAKHPILGLRPLAIVYSLPYAFLMWGMVAFIAAVLLYAFDSGISLASRYIVGAIAIGLGGTLLWAISYFWRDQLGFMDDFQRLQSTLQSLSRWRPAHRNPIPETSEPSELTHYPLFTNATHLTESPEKISGKPQEDV